MIIENWKKEVKKLKKLKKYLRKLYDKNNQTLYITSLEEWEGKECYLDIVATDKEGKKLGKWLFEVINLKAFETFEMRYNFYMKDAGFYEYFDVETASIIPFYFNRTFTLKKFTTITEEDVERCCKYFVEKVLNDYWIWNIKFVKPKSLSEKLLKEREKDKKKENEILK